MRGERANHGCTRYSEKKHNEQPHFIETTKKKRKITITIKACFFDCFEHFLVFVVIFWGQEHFIIMITWSLYIKLIVCLYIRIIDMNIAKRQKTLNRIKWKWKVQKYARGFYILDLYLSFFPSWVRMNDGLWLFEISIASGLKHFEFVFHPHFSSLWLMACVAGFGLFFMCNPLYKLGLASTDFGLWFCSVCFVLFIFTTFFSPFCCVALHFLSLLSRRRCPRGPPPRTGPRGRGPRPSAACRGSSRRPRPPPRSTTPRPTSRDWTPSSADWKRSPQAPAPDAGAKQETVLL